MAALPIVHVGAPLASIKGHARAAHGYAPPTLCSMPGARPRVPS